MRKILVVSDHPTHPVTGGNKMCIMQYVNLLRDNGFDVHLLYVHGYATPTADRDATASHWGNRFHELKQSRLQYYLQRISARCRKEGNERFIDLFYPWRLTDTIESLHKKYDFDGMICNYVWLSKAMSCSIPHKVMFTHDVFSNRNQRVKGAGWLSFPVKEEMKALKRCPVIFSIQEEESMYYRYLAPKSRVVTVYSSFTKVELLLAINKNILFFSGGQALNLNAIHFFMSEVLPLLVEKDREIKLVIGGFICEALKHEVLPANVVLTGTYDNPSDFYELGDVVINPVSEGTGLKIKTIEAIAHGKATVVDKHSLAGVYAPTMFPVLVANTPQEYAEHIMHLLGNERELQGVQKRCHDYINKVNDYIKRCYISAFSE